MFSAIYFKIFTFISVRKHCLQFRVFYESTDMSYMINISLFFFWGGSLFYVFKYDSSITIRY